MMPVRLQVTHDSLATRKTDSRAVWHTFMSNVPDLFDDQLKVNSPQLWYSDHGEKESAGSGIRIGLLSGCPVQHGGDPGDPDRDCGVARQPGSGCDF